MHLGVWILKEGLQHGLRQCTLWILEALLSYPILVTWGVSSSLIPEISNEDFHQVCSSDVGKG